MTEAGWLVAAIGLLIAGVVKGATGIGYSTCALPFLAVAVGMRNAIVLVVVPAIVSNVATMWRVGKFRETAARFWTFYLAIVPGVVLGTSALSHSNPAIAAQLLGCITLLYVALAWYRPALALPKHLERPLALPMGLLNGILTGMTGSQIMPLMPYFMSLKLQRDEQIQAINLAVTLASVVLAMALAQSGIMTPTLALASLVGGIPAYVGVAIGVYFGQRLSAPSFRQISLMTLAVLALPLLQRA